MQGAWVRSLVREQDPICMLRGAVKKKSDLSEPGSLLLPPMTTTMAGRRTVDAAYQCAGLQEKQHLLQRPSLSFSDGENFRTFGYDWEALPALSLHLSTWQGHLGSLSQGHLPCPGLCSWVVFVLTVTFKKYFSSFFKVILFHVILYLLLLNGK